jgi:hypothetical protein
MIRESSPRVILTWMPEISVSDLYDPDKPFREVFAHGVRQIASQRAFESVKRRMMEEDQGLAMQIIEVEAELMAHEILPHLQQQIVEALAVALGIGR